MGLEEGGQGTFLVDAVENGGVAHPWAPREWRVADKGATGVENSGL